MFPENVTTCRINVRKEFIAAQRIPGLPETTSDTLIQIQVFDPHNKLLDVRYEAPPTPSCQSDAIRL